MSLFVQDPALLGLLALAAVPVLVHLLARAQPPHYRFSNIEFLRKVLRLTSRFRKPKDWLLLALRTAALAALAAAFPGLVLTSKHSALPGESRALVLLIDRSGSMAAKEGAASRFDAACAEARRLLDSLRPDLSNIVWIDASPDAVFPAPAPNREFLTDELARATARAEPGALQAAFELATRQLQQSSGHRQLCVISDFQAAAWQQFTPNIPSDLPLRLVPVATADVPNLAVAALVPLPAAPVAGQALLAQCRVANHSGEARRVALTLDAGGARQSQALEVPARGQAEAVFRVHCTSPGLLPLSAEIDADAFPADDRRHAVVRVRESLRLALAAPAADPAARTLAQLARAVPWLDALPAVDFHHPPPCEALFVPAWDGTGTDTLRELAARNTAVIVSPAPGIDTTSLAALLGGAAPPAPGRLDLESSQAGWQVNPEDSHGAFRLFAGGEFGNPLAGRFFRRLNLTDQAGSTVPARFADGVPALLEAPDRPLLVSNLSLDPTAATWSREPSFVPAFAELLLHLLPRAAGESFEADPGTTLAWDHPAADAADAPQLELADGTKPALTRLGSAWQATGPAVPGIHRWLVSGQPVHLTAVNFPTTESPLRPLATPPAFAGTAALGGSRHAALHQGLPLWPWLLAAALLCLGSEALVTALDRRRPAPESPA